MSEFFTGTMRNENVARSRHSVAKSPKYQSLHAKFWTLLLTITVVDFGTYSHI